MLQVRAVARALAACEGACVHRPKGDRVFKFETITTDELFLTAGTSYRAIVYGCIFA
ncbi:MAG: hypothetical protein H0V62_09955 [Gammaproteobacteria bacterium]|nr:hypothetical protein [Gammaproteobacteria bacterium]